MSGGLPELGSKISLISKADIRYEGRLYTVDPQECTIALSSVRSFGTEDRDTQIQIAPQSQIYDYILFRGSDIKDIRVVNNSLPHPNDPAIMQVQLPNGQHLLPNFPMASMHPPPHAQMGGGGYGNPFGNLGNIAANLSGGVGNIGPSMAPGAAFIVGNHHQQQQTQQQPQPQQQQKPQQQQQPHQQQKQPISVLDMLASASRSTTPISLMSRKSPPAEMGMPSINHHQQQQVQQHHQNNQAQNAGHAGQSRDAGHKRQSNQQQNQQNQQQHHQQQPNQQQQQRGNGGNNRNGSNDYYQQRDQGRNLDHYNSHHDGRTYHQRNNQGGPNRSWPMNRGPNPNMMRTHRGGGSRGRVPNQSYRPMGGMGGVPAGQQNKPRNGKTIKFEQDFDFEQANNKFEELRSQLSKLKVADEPKSAEQCATPTSSQMNGETEKKDDSGNETGAGDHEHEDEEITVGYDKNKSFFDNISCEAAQDRSKNKKNDWRQERKLNSETFGVSSTRRGSYRGRGNYYNRNMGGYGGNTYNRGYRGSNNYRHRNNNRTGLNGGGPTAQINYTNSNTSSYPPNGNGNTNGASTSTSANASGSGPKNPTPQVASHATGTSAAASNNTPITKAAPKDSVAQPAPIAAAQ